MERIGFIGLGNMGLPMAANLYRKGFSLIVFDVRPEPVGRLELLGATAAADCSAVAAACDIVLTMLPNSMIVHEVVAGTDGLLAHLAAGKVIVDMSTVDPLVTDQ